jgi:hypothetical protein
MTRKPPAIIFVPGIRPKPPADLHAAQLRRCLTAGVLQAQESPEAAESLAAALRLVGWSLGFYGEHGDISVDLAGVERLLAGQDSVAADSQEARSLARRITGVLYAISDRFPVLTDIFATRRMETRVAEMHRYFFDRDGKATAARLMVADALQVAWDNGQQVLLIGHSFGSVIAYDTLWELCRLQGNPGKVDLFVTMGSPLTMNYIRKRLKGAHRPLEERYPVNINHWVNMAALGEVTALDRKLSDCFAEMVRLGFISSIDDNMTLVNQFHGPNGLNVHKCYGYLASPVVGQLLSEWSDRVSAVDNL